MSFTVEVLKELETGQWPGNVRELRNVIERAMILSDGRSLSGDFPAGGNSGAPTPVTLAEAERVHVLAALGRARWRISGKGGAAEALGLLPTTLHSLMKRLGISRSSLYYKSKLDEKDEILKTLIKKTQNIEL